MIEKRKQWNDEWNSGYSLPWVKEGREIGWGTDMTRGRSLSVSS